MENLTQKDLNYYIPSPKEIHIGLKYEMRDWVDTARGPKEEWIKKEWTEYDCLADISTLFEYDDIRIHYITQDELLGIGCTKVSDTNVYELDRLKIERMSAIRWRFSFDDKVEFALTARNIDDLVFLINQILY